MLNYILADTSIGNKQSYSLKLIGFRRKCII